MENISLSGHSAFVSSDTSHDDSSNLADQDEYGNQSGIGKSAPEKGSKKKKGKSAANVKGGSAESGVELQESTKKKQKKGKVNPGAQVSDPKSGAKKDTERLDQPSFLSEKSLIQKIMSMIPDLEEQGDLIMVSSYLKFLFHFLVDLIFLVGLDDPETVLAPLAQHLRPMLLNSWMERRKAAFTENAQQMKQLLDDLQRKLDEVVTAILFVSLDP